MQMYDTIAAAQKECRLVRGRQDRYSMSHACHRDAALLKTAEEGVVLACLRRARLHRHWQFLLLLQAHTYMSVIQGYNTA